MARTNGPTGFLAGGVTPVPSILPEMGTTEHALLLLVLLELGLLIVIRRVFKTAHGG